MSGEEEEWKQQIPTGFRFAPTDAELMQHYLLPKVTGQFILHGIIHDDVNVYERSPSHLPGMDTEEEFTYFFTSRERKYPNGRKNDRVTKDRKGYWKMTNKITKVYADKNDMKSYLGKKNTLVYYVKTPKGKKDCKTNWIMHEFELDEKKVFPSTPSSPSQEKQFINFVVCRVYKRQIKDKRETDEQKDELINSLIGPKPVMAHHHNNGEPPVLLPSLKRKFEPNMETCDHPHDTAIAMNSNYLYGSHDLQAPAILGNMMTTSYDFGQTSKFPRDDIMVMGEGVLGGTSNQARATVYQEHRSQQSPHIVEKENSGLVDEEPNNIPLGLFANDLATISSGELWEMFIAAK